MNFRPTRQIKSRKAHLIKIILQTRGFSLISAGRSTLSRPDENIVKDEYFLVPALSLKKFLYLVSPHTMTICARNLILKIIYFNSILYIYENFQYDRLSQ